MKKEKTDFHTKILSPLAVMALCILGAYFVYSAFYQGDRNSASLAQIEPAAGADQTMQSDANYIIIDTENIPVWSDAPN